MQTERTMDGIQAGPLGRPEQVQLVTFDLAGERFAVDIHAVREIDRLVGITRVPKSPPEVAGVMNLRGKIIPVVCLRTKFGLPESSPSDRTRIVVLEHEGRETGLIVDRVHEVLRIDSSILDPSPGLMGTVHAGYIRGIAKPDGRLLIVLDLLTLFSELDLGSLDFDEAA